MIVIEIWKDVKGYECLYQVSNLGNVRSKNKVGIDGRKIEGKLLKGGMFSNKYKFVCLRKQGENKNCLIHRLVAEAFIPNPNNYPIVNHKDGNKQNNNVENLEWCTYHENRMHANKLGLTYQKGKPRKVTVELDEKIIEFETMKACCDFFGFKKGWVNTQIRKHGLTFKYKSYLIRVSERG